MTDLQAALTKIVQGWPKLWAKFRDLIWIFSQSVGPSLTIWVNSVQNLFSALAQWPGRAHGVDVGDAVGAHLVGGEVEQVVVLLDAAPRLGFGRIVASEIAAPNM